MNITKAGLAAGIVGGAFDLAAAATIYPAMYGIPPLRIVQSIASGVLGARAYEGGMQTALLGAGLHFLIAIVAGIVLAVAMTRIEALRQSVAVTAAGFGIAMYFFMQLIVLPLSQFAQNELSLAAHAVGLSIHIFIFALPMVLVARQLLAALPAASRA
jgi:hypothetical protein